MAVSPSGIQLPQRYRVLRHIANGGMASVWAAHDEVLGRDVAIKVLAPHLAQDERARTRFTREARMVAGLSNHPHVVTIYDVGEHDGVSFIVMELLRGGTVADRLKQGRIPQEQALRWLAETAGGLDAAHQADIVHRDVKPANLLLDERDRLAIGDFGIARLALEDQLTNTGIVLGTASYIAPEQAEGHGATPASDRYSLAVLAFEVLTGQKPFQAEHFAAQARAHVEDEPPRPTSIEPRLPAAVDDVLLRGLSKDPRKRWPSATEMIDALRRALQSEPTRATAAAAPPTRPTRHAPIGHRDPGPRRTAWLILAALALAAVALALALSSGGDDGGGDESAATPTPTAEAKKDKKKEKEPAAQEAAPAATATPAPTEAPGNSGSAPGNLSDARRLQLAGFAANNSGHYEEGLRVSQQAVETCGDQRALDPCGYALYEMGRALVGLGREDEAIAPLEQRLDLYGDNASGDVQRMLDQARGDD